MKRPSLLQGIIVAVLLSLAAPAVHHLVDLLVPRMLALKLVIAALTTAYVFYLLRLHHARIGNFVLGIGTALILIAALLWGMATSTLVFVSITLIWIVRSLIAYSSVFMSILDGALCFLGLGVAVWAYGATGSAFWAIWCFFLSQSLFALGSPRPPRRPIHVFIASPGDLAVEPRAFKEVSDELNGSFGDGAGVRFVALGWEDTLATAGRHAQGVINKGHRLLGRRRIQGLRRDRSKGRDRARTSVLVVRLDSSRARQYSTSTKKRV